MISIINICGAVTFVIFSLVGFSGNAITAIALLRDSKIRQHSTTAFILSLCISDWMFCTVCMPTTATAFLNETLMVNQIICKLYGAAFYINFGVTTFSIAGIAINRYILIVHHNFYKSFYRKHIVFYQLLIIWLLPVALLITPTFDVWGTIGKHKTLCKVMEKDGSSMETVLFAAGIITPCVIIGVLYACIFCKVRRHLNRATQMSCSSSVQVKERHLTMMTLLIFISYVVCCLPPTIEHFWFLQSNSEWPNLIGFSFCGLLTIINPFIYAATNRKYRAAYVKLFADIKSWSFADENSINHNTSTILSTTSTITTTTDDIGINANNSTNYHRSSLSLTNCRR